MNQVHQYYWDCATGVLNDDVFQSNQSVDTHYGYDVYGRVTSETDGYGLSSANQRTTTTAYDDNYRQVTVTQDGLYAHIYQYDELGQQFLDRLKPILELWRQARQKIGLPTATAPPRTRVLSSFSQMASPAPAVKSPLAEDLAQLISPRFLERVPVKQTPDKNPSKKKKKKSDLMDANTPSF